MAGKPGRPKGSVKLTGDKQERIVEALEGGHSLASAARLAGFHRDTVHRWMTRGRKGESPLFVRFFDAVQEALARSEHRLTSLMMNHAEKDWRAAAWLLSRRFPHWRDKPIVSQETRERLDNLKVKREELELEAIRYQLGKLKEKEDSLDLLEVLGAGG